MTPGQITEEKAFRLVVIVGAAAISIIIVTAITSSTVGSIWGLILLIAGLTALYRAWDRGRIRDRRRLMIVAEGPLDPQAVRARFGDRWAAEPHEVLVVVPSQHRGCASKVERERQGMELSLQAVKEAGANARGRVIEDDPKPAAAAAHTEFAPHEVLIATKSPDQSAWSGLDPMGDVDGLDATSVTRTPLVRS